MKIKPKRYIVWSADKEVDLSNEWQRKWYIKQVLIYGRAEDIAELDWEEIKNVISELDLPKNIKSFWEFYFDSKK
jgi:hypothetical protein